MFNIQLSDPKESTEVLPSSRGKQPRGSGMVTVHTDMPRVRVQLQEGFFQGCSMQGTKGSCPGELQRGVEGQHLPCSPHFTPAKTAVPAAQGEPGQSPAGAGFQSSLHYLHYF